MTEQVKTQKGSVASGVFWMFFISLFLFWIPVLSGFIAGFVGGKKSGGVGKAITAVFIPAIIFGGILFAFAGSITGLPIIGAIAGGSAIILSLVHVGPMLLGAIIGGAFA